VNKGYVDEGFVEDVTNGSDTGSYVPYVRFRDHYGSRGYWFPLWSVTRARYLGLYVTMQDLVNSYGYSESTVGAYAVVGDYSDPNKKIYMAVYFDYNASPQQIIWQEISNEQAPPLENPFLSKDLLALGTIEADNEITLLNVYDHTNDPDANISQYMGVYDVLPETPERSKTLIGVKVIRNDGYIISRLFTTGTIPPGQSRRISKIICSNGGISFVMRDQNEEALGLAGGSLPTTNFKQIILVTESRPSSWYRLIGYTAKRGN
jgi:hypothetical protein